ncbi:binding-protein-dependent transport systems inner membrane component [Beutenbergia cavernae DSM 12333]|uniref:Binding-protein-dependent transport systems inner membrane component n=1 Tax=Beutenbergia cavernae (strain ATCC BAA-8 / DSM 12333 / CCUG 43141 / JCM 11478 / NBRC 16432 / NCIMB 13614 / HKI 0122) TaxID=471853 RepID=C5C2B6_BEUC1|nr:ABC transporter permease [Beutenbergia cavernae]ACQ81741.1 binding-protein-dependent transport systems inner membrane component [Beutenbergia cavernae DSM 12333]
MSPRAARGDPLADARTSSRGRADHLSGRGRGTAGSGARAARGTPAVRGVRAVAWRLAGAVGVLWAAATVTFVAIRTVPGDPAQAILGGPGSQASAEALAQARADHGLDRPVLEQYLAYLGRLVRGDLGTSYARRTPVAELIGDQLPGTLTLAALALVLAWALALVSLLVTTRQRGGWDAVGNAIDTFAAALPAYWLGAVGILVFSTWLGWLPAIAGQSAASLVLPTLTLAIPLAGFLAQSMRETLTDSLHAPYTLSARARGEGEAGVRLRHSIRHASLPGIALSGWALGHLVGGAVVVETIFARPGLGRTLVAAVTARDVPLVTGVVLVSALAYVVVTIVADAVTRLADPRPEAAR